MPVCVCNWQKKIEMYLRICAHSGGGFVLCVSYRIFIAEKSVYGSLQIDMK